MLGLILIKNKVMDITQENIKNGNKIPKGILHLRMVTRMDSFAYGRKYGERYFWWCWKLADLEFERILAQFNHG